MPGDNNPVLVTVTRGDLVESCHRGAVAVIREGEEIFGIGETGAQVYLRSALKPVQALPAIFTGAVDRWGLTESEIAVACGSHNGEDVHVRAVRSILAKAKVPEVLLQCRAIEPLDPSVRRALDRRGGYSPVRNNCSGKHAMFLAVAKHIGAELESYTNPEHPVQQIVSKTIAELADEEPTAIPHASDGCGAPTYALPLRKIALVFARLANPQMIENSELRAAAERIRDAMANHPYMVAGRGRLCTEVMEATQGRVLAKSGAEGVYALGLVDKNIGFAVKVDDGSSRGYFPVVVQFLLDTGTLADATAARLESFRRPSIMNQKGEIVGVADLTPEVTFATLFDE